MRGILPCLFVTNLLLTNLQLGDSALQVHEACGSLPSSSPFVILSTSSFLLPVAPLLLMVPSPRVLADEEHAANAASVWLASSGRHFANHQQRRSWCSG